MMEKINLELSNYEYHAGPGISKSGLDLIARSPAHYIASKKAEREPTRAMIIGSMFHTLVLEPESFLLEYAICPEGIDRRTKAGKEAWSAFEFAANGKEIIKASDLECIQGMADSILRHPFARQLVTGGTAEQSIFWNTSIVENTLCKCRPDFVKDLEGGGYVIVDLKSTEDARPWAFERSAWNYRYHVQAPFYWDGCTEAFNHAPEAFIFVVVEKALPYAVAIYEATQEMMNAGREEYFHDLRIYKECMDTGIWPAYPMEIQKLYPPKWAQ